MHAVGLVIYKGENGAEAKRAIAVAPPFSIALDPATQVVSTNHAGTTEIAVQVRSNVAARGVDFKLTASDKSEIMKAGGSQALINVIGVSYIGQNSAAAVDTYATTTTAVAPTNRYNELIDQAINQYDVQKNSAAAIATLKQAIAVDPAQPRAYQQVGFAYLYGQKNFDEAENYMKQAIEQAHRRLSR